MREACKEFVMEIDGMTSEEGAEVVTKAVKTLDPEADVQADLTHARITVMTRAQSIEVAQAINKAGYAARAMTG